MKLSLIVLGALALCSNAFAQKLSYDQLKEACKKPESFHNQNKPANMEVSCEDRQTRWIPIENGAYSLPRARKMTIAFTSDKYELPSSGKDVGVAAQPSACPKFKEIVEKLQTSRATSCEEILGFEGTELQFCMKIIDELRGSVPPVPADTGRVVAFCAPTTSNSGGNNGGNQGK